jgi:NAD(P)-dependent dehydrogenase (short-subunit alcohol dehydrogenase family)
MSTATHPTNMLPNSSINMQLLQQRTFNHILGICRRGTFFQMSRPNFKGKLNGQRVLLVGGSGNVGIALAQALLEFGATVMFSSSRPSKVISVSKSLANDYPEAEERISGHVCDLGSPNVESNIEALFGMVGEVDHIVYMAGDRLPEIDLEDVTLEKWEKCNQVRTIAAILVVKVGTRYLKKDCRSSIVLTGGSISEKPIVGGWSMLALMSGGINGLTRQLALDLAPIRVNAVAPGIIEKDFWQEGTEEGRKAFLRDQESMNPTGKVAQPEDLAEAYLYCLRDLNATGSVVHSNSGIFLV